ncbi:MAG: outer membrane lipoprotein carrier protein LolA [Alphaproteobacteria bacterium]|nr:outer membrane lipoprotein carrier protein LolA [Alphaproteobacteria bacterium]MCB9975304.1 outer membrane lipoprotein carrier protein LolA [Rhodospirillales bacterium]
MAVLMKRFVLIASILGLFAAVPAQAAVDEGVVKRAEAYFQKLKTAQARFIQTNTNGQQLTGTFYLSRPGKLRFEYDPPSKDFVVADGKFIYFYDGELEEQTNAPIGTTLADFFLRKDFTLHGDLTVKDTRDTGGFIQIEVTQTEDPGEGTLTFAFTPENFTLKKWRVVDAQGALTEVELFYLKTGVELDKKLFGYVDPRLKDDNRKPRFNE